MGVNNDVTERLMTKIKTNSLTKSDFVQLANSGKMDIKNISINGIRDNNFFSYLDIH